MTDSHLNLSHINLAHQVRVQTQDFDVGAELSALRAGQTQAGALVSFVGLVREMVADGTLTSMTLEHYPAMTERSLQVIVAEAQARWPLLASLVIHRVGELNPSEQIVLVATLSPHRQDAFAACAYIMDYLKTDAPFWKKEQGAFGERWVEARDSDEQAKQQWLK